MGNVIPAVERAVEPPQPSVPRCGVRTSALLAHQRTGHETDLSIRQDRLQTAENAGFVGIEQRVAILRAQLGQVETTATDGCRTGADIRRERSGLVRPDPAGQEAPDPARYGTSGNQKSFRAAVV